MAARSARRRRFIIGMKLKDRVRAHTSREVNRRIEEQTEHRVLQAATAADTAISRRIDELEEEWDMERFLETNASALAFAGIALGLAINKNFFGFQLFVLLFFFEQ